MKSFILCFFVLATLVVNIHSLTDDQIKAGMAQIEKVLGQVDDTLKECQQLSKVTDREIKDLREKKQVSNSPEIKKYLGCVAIRVGFVKLNGEFNKEFLRWVLKLTNNQNKADEIIQECAIKKSSKEETGSDLLKCMIVDKGTDFYPAN